MPGEWHQTRIAGLRTPIRHVTAPPLPGLRDASGWGHSARLFPCVVAAPVGEAGNENRGGSGGDGRDWTPRSTRRPRRGQRQRGRQQVGQLRRVAGAGDRRGHRRLGEEPRERTAVTERASARRRSSSRALRILRPVVEVRRELRRRAGCRPWTPSAVLAGEEPAREATNSRMPARATEADGRGAALDVVAVDEAVLVLQPRRSAARPSRPEKPRASVQSWRLKFGKLRSAHLAVVDELTSSASSGLLERACRASSRARSRGRCSRSEALERAVGGLEDEVGARAS